MSDVELSRNDEWAETLFRLTGPNGGMSVKRLAKASGVKATTLYKIRASDHNPKWSEARKLLKAMPNTAVNDVLRPLGLTVQALEGKRCDHTTLAYLGRTTGEFAQALEDGRIDHLERGQIRPFVESLRNLCDAWLAEENPTTKRIHHLGVVNSKDQ